MNCRLAVHRFFSLWNIPDLVIEVLSKVTRKNDMFLKLQKYMTAGVREYWMVDPDRKR